MLGPPHDAHPINSGDPVAESRSKVAEARSNGVDEVNIDHDADQSDIGSMLSHDPEDEDAEPDWLESD